MGDILLRNVRICLPDKLVTGYIGMRNGEIVEIGEGEPSQQYGKEVDGLLQYALPGFIDGHIHGAAGADTMDATQESLHKMAAWLPNEGTTTFLATTITQEEEAIETALEQVRLFIHQAGEAELIGVHLEGPFVNPVKAGAQPLAHIRQPDTELFQKWQKLSGNKIKVVTLAPECDEDYQLTQLLASEQIVASAGHTDSSFEQIKDAAEQGITQLTHLCNQMNGIYHRDVGAVGAAFLLPDLMSELIADGIHVAPEMLRLIYKNVGPDRLILITDSLRGKGLEDGTYDLGGQAVTVKDGKALLPDGTLAGSMLQMKDAVRNMATFADVSVADIAKMTAENPAKQYGIYDRKGSLAIGKDADIVLLDDQLTLQATYCKGNLAYQKEEESC
ncbi:N-acetylglucosamine-6-phosphate deacetylase [Terribacillus saccharophilus]|uniref:N-acetylglucosamine-6-phosphate deacetylase n=1 Tax=Terribacillus saccharophilus TaxID=361277 RepID=UPI002DCE1C9E|nr:N-acetylglucosamine-6-phosphate deacetylase [Terribacillus saccharophilus]MEC0289066.1 N-acetylglucosamine-6-phosphate deacetylase [Terribacillus saccharophilus]